MEERLNKVEAKQKRLEKQVKNIIVNLDDDKAEISKLSLKHKATIESHISMKEDIKSLRDEIREQMTTSTKMYEGLEAHMEDEAVMHEAEASQRVEMRATIKEHHTELSQAVGQIAEGLAASVNEATRYRTQRMEEEKEREDAKAVLVAEEKEASNRFKDTVWKVGGTLITAVLLALGTILWNSIVYFSEAKANDKRLQAQVANQEELLRYEQLRMRYDKQIPK